MRAVAIMVCAVVATASAAGAQGWSYGVKAGVTLSTLDIVNKGVDTSLSIRTGLAAGGYLTWPIAGRLGLEPEILFAQKGATFDDAGARLALKLDYLEVPVLVTFRVFGGQERHVTVFGGPSIALRLRAKARASYGGGDVIEQDISDEVSRTDVAVVSGAAYHRGRLVVDGRYSWGLSEVDELSVGEAISKVRTGGLAFLAGWRF